MRQFADGIKRRVVAPEMIILPNRQRHGLLELAAYLGDEAMVERNRIWGLRCHSNIRTAGYWAASQDNKDVFDSVCDTTRDKVYTLWQLQQDGKISAFEKFYAHVSQEVREQFDNNLDQIIKVEVETTHELGYFAACKGDRNNLQKFCHEPKKLYAVIAYAFAQNNFVVLYQCMEIWKKLSAHQQNIVTRSIVQAALNTNNHGTPQFELMICWFVTNNIHPYHFLLNNPDEMLRKKLVSEIWSQEGLRQYVISRIICFNRKEDCEFFLRLEKRDVSVFNSLLRCLQRRNDAPVFSQLLQDQNDMRLQRRFDSVVASSDERNFLAEMFKKFGLAVQNKRVDERLTLNSFPNTVLLKIINEMLYGQIVDLEKFQKEEQGEAEYETKGLGLGGQTTAVKRRVARDDKHALDAKNFPHMLLNRRFYLISQLTNPSDAKKMRQKFDDLDVEIKHHQQAIHELEAKIDEADSGMASLDSKQEKIRELLELMEYELTTMSCSQRPWPLRIYAGTIFLNILTYLNVRCYDKFQEVPMCHTAATNYTDIGCHESLAQAGSIVTLFSLSFLAFGANIRSLLCTPFEVYDAKAVRTLREGKPLTFYSEDLKSDAKSIIDTDEKPLDLKSTFKDVRETLTNLLPEIPEKKTQIAHSKFLLQQERNRNLAIVTQRKNIQSIYERGLSVFEKKRETKEVVSKLQSSSQFNLSSGDQKETKADFPDVVVDVSSLVDTPFLENEPPKSRCPRFGGCEIL
jgi:hypothetical protein